VPTNRRGLSSRIASAGISREGLEMTKRFLVVPTSRSEVSGVDASCSVRITPTGAGVMRHREVPPTCASNACIIGFFGASIAVT
jgi:hypothetical protein